MSNNSENKEPLNKSFKVPKLRFPEFKDEWTEYKLSTISQKITQKNTNNEINEVISNSAIYGLVAQEDFFDKDIVNDKNKNKYFVINKGDFVYNPRKSIQAPYGPINLLENYESGIVSPLYTCFTVQKDYTTFLKWYFKSNKWYKYIYINGDKGARGDRVSIKDSVFYGLTLYAPYKSEMNKIDNFLSAIDEKINVLSMKISTLKKYKEGYSKAVIKSCSNNNTMLSSICDITTGKLDANAMSAQGKYKFFTCSREDYLIDTYAFDCEAILVSGNGDVGLTKYYRGKFNAYQRTYVLHNFKRDPLFIQICIDSLIKSVIRKETNKGAMPYIKLSTFDKLIIPDLAADKEKVVSSNIKLLKNKEKLLTLKLEALSLIKKYLLNTLFI